MAHAPVGRCDGGRAQASNPVYLVPCPPRAEQSMFAKRSAAFAPLAPVLPRRAAGRAPVVVLSAGRAAAAAAAVAAAAVVLGVGGAGAISGGGKDFASKNWTGQAFSGSFVEKDFSGAIMRACDLSGSDFTSARFFKAELRDANLTGANLSFASVEGAVLRDAVFTDAVMVSSYISDSILDAASIENVDFTDALITPESTVVKLCQREDARGVNPTTKVATRESLMCLD